MKISVILAVLVVLVVGIALCVCMRTHAIAAEKRWADVKKCVDRCGVVKKSGDDGGVVVKKSGVDGGREPQHAKHLPQHVVITYENGRHEDYYLVPAKPVTNSPARLPAVIYDDAPDTHDDMPAMHSISNHTQVLQVDC